MPELKLVALGTLPRQSAERALTLAFSPDQAILACQAADKTVDFYRVHSADEIKKRVARRAKRLREKAAAAAAAGDAGEAALEAAAAAAATAEATLEDSFYPCGTLKLGSKIRSCAFLGAGTEEDTYKVQ